MNKLFSLLVLSVLIFSGLSVYTQTITGKILDSNTREPLSGATVQIVNSLKGNVAAADGSYSIIIPDNKKVLLRAGFIGYKPVTKEVSTQKGETVSVDFLLESQSLEQEEIIVTGTRIETAKANVPLSTTVISNEKIVRSSEINIMPMLGSNVPGVFITERGITGFGVSDGSAGKATIRGVGASEQSRLLIMVDGQPQVMGLFGHAFPDMYQSSNVEKAEVIRGPASMLYGSNAMGGVINLITRKQKNEGFNGSVSASLGSFMTIRGTATAGYKKNNFSVFAAYNHDRTNGARPNSSFRGDNGYLSLGYKFNEHFDLSWTSNFSDFNAVDPGSVYADTSVYSNNKAWADIFRVNSIITLNNKFDKVTGNVKVFFNRGNHSLYTNWVSTDMNYGVSLFEGIKLHPNTLLGTGIDWNKYGGIGSPVMSASLVDGKVKMVPSEYNNKWIDVNETGLYAFLQQRLFNIVLLNAGIRYNYHSIYKGQWIPQLGATVKAGENNEFKALVSKGFRSPNVKELYFFPPANPNLLPESMWNYEVAYTQYAFNKKLKAEATLFYIDGKNLIQAIPNPTGNIPPMLNQNTGKFTNYGVEVEASYRIRPELSVNATYSYLHTDVARIASPEHQANINGSYTLGKFDFNLSLQGVFGLYNQIDNAKTIDIDESDIQNYVLLNSKISYRLTPSVNFYISADNILNQEYSTTYGYPMPGTTFFAGVMIRIN